MKDLNQSQLILLAILISFITSIATGIVTVTLLQQAPASVTMPINRIVRQTVEKIVPGEGKNTVQTVVVKEEDLVVDAIAKNESAVFSVTKDGLDQNGSYGEVSAGRGVAVSSSGIIAVDASLAPGSGNYYVKNGSGKFKATFLLVDKLGFSLLKVEDSLDSKNKLAYTKPVAGDLSKMKAGQKIILFGSSIASFIYDGSDDLKISVAKSNAGGLILDLDGNALGVALSGENTSFVSISDVFKVSEASPKV